MDFSTAPAAPQPPAQQPAPLPAFPSLKQLFSDSWNNLVGKILPVLIFNSIALGITVTAVILFIILLTAFASLGNLINNPLASSIPILIMLVAAFMLLIVLSAIFHIGNILIMSSNSFQISYKSILKSSFSMIFPVVLINLAMAFLILGGFILFVLPGIILALLFQFAVLLVILDKLSLASALKRSVYIVSRSFGQIFVRQLILILIPFGASLIFSFLSITSLDETPLNILNILFSIFYSFFAISYTLTLFKQAKASAGEGTSNIRFILLVSVGGWILGFLISIFGFGIISSLVNRAPASNSLNLPLASPGITDFDFEEEAFLGDDLFIATPSAKPSVKALSSPKAKTATPSSVTR